MKTKQLWTLFIHLKWRHIHEWIRKVMKFTIVFYDFSFLIWLIFKNVNVWRYTIQAALVIRRWFVIRGFDYPRPVKCVQILLSADIALDYPRGYAVFLIAKKVQTVVPCYSRIWYLRDILGTKPLRKTRVACTMFIISK